MRTSLSHQGPQWLWTLPGGLRPSGGETPWQDAAHVVHALSVQSALRPYVADIVSGGGNGKAGCGHVRGDIRSHWRWIAALLLALMLSAGWWWGRGGAVAWLGVWAVAVLGCGQVLLRRWGAQLSFRSTEDHIIVRWRSGFGWRWQELCCPISDYRGVARWSGAALHHAPFVTWTHRWWVVALVHRTDPTLSLPLALCPSSGALASLQHRAAHALGVPVLLDGVHGAGWLPYPSHNALLTLSARLAQDSAPRFGSSTPPPGLSLATPLQHDFPPGGPSAWLTEVKDRWLALLFLLPIGGFLGGPWGMALGSLLPLVVGGMLWRYWQGGDGWRCDGHSLTVLSGMRWRWSGRQSLSIPLSVLLAVRFQGSDSQPPAFEIETTSGTHRVRTGTATRADTQAALDRLLMTLQREAVNCLPPK